MYDNNTWRGWFWNKYDSAKEWFWGSAVSSAPTYENVRHIRKEFLEYTIGLIGKGNLDVAAINFTGLGFFNQWLTPDAKLRTPGTKVAFSLIAFLTGVRLLQNVSGKLLKSAQQKHQEDQLSYFWKWAGKLSSLVQFGSNMLTGCLYELSTLLVLGLFVEPGFEWFGLPEEYYPHAESVTVGLGLLKSLFYFLDNIEGASKDFNKTWKKFDVPMQKFTDDEKKDIIMVLEKKLERLLDKDEKKQLFASLENMLTDFVAEKLNQPQEQEPLLIQYSHY